MPHRHVTIAIVVTLATLALAGCRAGESIGGEAWLDYDGPHSEAVLACVRAMPATIHSPSGIPGAAEFHAVIAVAEEADDGRIRYDVAGALRLSYTGEPEVNYHWACEVSQYLTMVDVTDVSHELLE